MLPWVTNDKTKTLIHIDVVADGHQEIITCGNGQKMIDHNNKEVTIPFELTCNNGVFSSDGPPVNKNFLKLRCFGIYFILIHYLFLFLILLQGKLDSFLSEQSFYHVCSRDLSLKDRREYPMH